MDTEHNPYACLGLIPGSSPAEIKCRYRQLAKQYHPDCNRQVDGFAGDREAKLRALNAAYTLLSDPAAKSAYDARFSSAFEAVYTPQPLYRSSRYRPAPLRVPSRRRSSLRAFAVTLLVLISTGVGIFSSTVKDTPSLMGLLPQMSRSASTDSAPPPVFYFVTPHGTFDQQNNAADADQETQP